MRRPRWWKRPPAEPSRRWSVHCECGASTFPNEAAADAWISHHTCVTQSEQNGSG